MATFTPMSPWAKAALCIPFAGFLVDTPEIDGEFITNIAGSILDGNPPDSIKNDFQLKEKIIKESCVIFMCIATNALLTVITAVAISCLQGVIATCAAVVLGIAGSLLLVPSLAMAYRAGTCVPSQLRTT